MDEGGDVLSGEVEGVECGGEVLRGEELRASAFGGEEGSDAAEWVVELGDEDGGIDVERARNIGEGLRAIGEEIEKGWRGSRHTRTGYKLETTCQGGVWVVVESWR